MSSLVDRCGAVFFLPLLVQLYCYAPLFCLVPDAARVSAEIFESRFCVAPRATYVLRACACMGCFLHYHVMAYQLDWTRQARGVAEVSFQGSAVQPYGCSST